jgi:hypothetical protein
MIKKLSSIIVVLMVLVLQGCQLTPVTTESIPVSKVVKVDGASKLDLFVKANDWMVDSFQNADSVIQFADKESGSVSGRYLLGVVVAPNEYGSGQKAYATIRIKVKEGAAKITITPESFTYVPGNLYTLYTKEKADADVNRLMNSFESAMMREVDNDW